MTQSNPMKIVAYLGFQALGDYVMGHTCASSIARACAGKLAIIFSNDRPYKKLLNEMNPDISTVLQLADDKPTFLETVFGPKYAALPRPWILQGFHQPDLVIPPIALQIENARKPYPFLEFPTRLQSETKTALIDAGVDPNKWFSCLHVRELGYQYRRNIDKDRCADPNSYLLAIDRIIQLGGQVVRVGDESMSPLPQRDGLIDLCRHPMGFQIQAFATSQARFFIGCDTGPTQLATALAIPSASTNALGIGVWGDGDVVHAKRHITEEGIELTLNELLECGILCGARIRPKLQRVINASPELLRDIAEYMIQKTVDCPNWRSKKPKQPIVDKVLSEISMPLETHDLAECVDIRFWQEGQKQPFTLSEVKQHSV